MNLNSDFNILLFIVKIVCILLVITHIYLQKKGQENTDLDNKIVYWEERFGLLFNILIALFMILLFNPINSVDNVVITGETKILFFLFGFVLLLTVPWKKIMNDLDYFLTF